jgi:hypothetical protein
MNMHGHIDRDFTLGDGMKGIGEGDERIGLPDPRFCNLKLNVMRVMYASGAADVIEEQQKDFDHTAMQSFVLGTSAEMDQIFLNKLHMIAVM